MSLLEEAMVDCVMQDKITLSDGYGGYITRYIDGAEFKAAIVRDSSLQARIAEKDGVKDIYTITTDKSLNLDFHDVLKRVSDGKILRVTTNSTDRATPDSATLNMRQVSAEEWSIPKDGVENG
jgi:hypothetical protein